MREGKIEITEDAITVVTGSQRRICPISEIEEISVDRINLYGSTFDKLTIAGKTADIRLYSDEISGRHHSSMEKVYSFRDISHIISVRMKEKEQA